MAGSLEMPSDSAKRFDRLEDYEVGCVARLKIETNMLDAALNLAVYISEGKRFAGRILSNLSLDGLPDSYSRRLARYTAASPPTGRLFPHLES